MSYSGTMIQFSLATDEFGQLQCTLSNGRVTAHATASKVEDALADLAGALENAGGKGVGECFWPRESGAYRWLIRKEGERGRLVVLWSIGTMTGWENVFWAEDEWAPLEQAILSGVRGYAHA